MLIKIPDLHERRKKFEFSICINMQTAFTSVFVGDESIFKGFKKLLIVCVTNISAEARSKNIRSYTKFMPVFSKLISFH